MSEHDTVIGWLRIEAVNLDQFVYDTDDLATIRGSGLLLLSWSTLFDGADSAFWKPAGTIRYPEIVSVMTHRLVSAGASNAVLEITGPKRAINEQFLKSLCDDAGGFLREHEKFRFATFVVDAVLQDQSSPDYKVCLERLISRNRRSQLQQIDVPIPSPVTSVRASCGIDCTRPATEAIEHDPRRRSACQSVALRRTEGRSGDGKNQLLARLSGDFANAESADGRSPFPDSTHNLEELAKSIGHQELDVDDRRRDEELRHRCAYEERNANRMAVLYFDGNGFGSIQRQLATTVAGHRRWDEFVRKRRQHLVGCLLKHIANEHNVLADLSGWHTADDRVRIETLLWGGDEHIWVVPAWKAWETLEFFFEQTTTRDWQIDRHKLTHAAGVVLCSHKSPIRDAVHLAKALAESVKRDQRHLPTVDPASNSDASQVNAFAYQVLESFDHLGEDFAAARKRRSPHGVNQLELLLHADALELFAEARKRLRDDLPRSRLYRITRSLFQNDTAVFRAELDRMFKVAQNKALRDRIDESVVAWRLLLNSGATSLGDTESTPKSGRGYLHGESSFWLHLMELWDYLPDFSEWKTCRTAGGHES